MLLEKVSKRKKKKERVSCTNLVKQVLQLPALWSSFTWESMMLAWFLYNKERSSEYLLVQWLKYSNGTGKKFLNEASIAQKCSSLIQNYWNVNSDYSSKIIEQLAREPEKLSSRIPNLVTLGLRSERVKFQVPTTDSKASIYSYMNHFGHELDLNYWTSVSRHSFVYL